MKHIIWEWFIGEMKGIGELIEDLWLVTVNYSNEFVKNSDLDAKYLTECSTMVYVIPFFVCTV